MLKEFWDHFSTLQPDHPVYQRNPDQRMRTIPVALHGDEGKGLGKTPVLVMSYQLVIPYTGGNCLNSTKPPVLL